jgi:hypothetical protein
MRYVFVHFALSGVPVEVHDDDAFVDGVFVALPDACLGVHHEQVTVTLSQFAVTDRQAIRRQRRRVELALIALGYANARAVPQEVVRESRRESLRTARRHLTWHVRHRLGLA